MLTRSGTFAFPQGRRRDGGGARNIPVPTELDLSPENAEPSPRSKNSSSSNSSASASSAGRSLRPSVSSSDLPSLLRRNNTSSVLLRGKQGNATDKLGVPAPGGRQLLKGSQFIPSSTKSPTGRQRRAIVKKLEDLARKFYLQLTEGCKRENCPNKFCASCPECVELTPEQAVVWSIQLAAWPRLYLCPPLLSASSIAAPSSESSPSESTSSPQQQRLSSSHKTSSMQNQPSFLYSVFSGSSLFSALFKTENEEEIERSDASSSRKKELLASASGLSGSLVLDLDYVKSVIERLEGTAASHTSAQHADLKRVIMEGFGDSQVLNRSFRKKDSFNKSTKPEDFISVLDLEGVSAAYNAILDLKRAPITHTLENATELVVSRLYYRKQLIKSHIDLRQIPILLENPLLRDTQQWGSTAMLRTLMETIVSLNEQFQRILVQWFSKYPADKFLSLVKAFHSFIDTHLRANILYKDDSIFHAVKCLNLLHEANEIGRLIPYPEFYNTSICNKVDLRADFRRWQGKRKSKRFDQHEEEEKEEEKGKEKEEEKEAESLNASASSSNAPTTDRAAESDTEEFAYCRYPFLLDAFSKARLLHIEAAILMTREVEDAMARLTFFGMISKYELPVMLPSNIKRAGVPHCWLEIRRDELVSDTFTQIEVKRADLKKPLRIKFLGEDGVDVGGVLKEFFQLIIMEVFDPKYGMFVNDEKRRMSWFNVASFESVDQYRLVGMLLGLAIYNGVILDIHFPMVIYKKLLGKEPTFEDLCAFDPDLGNGLKQMLNDNESVLEDVYCSTFEVDHEIYGERQTVELKPNGAEIEVTQENKQEYVDLYVKHLLVDSLRFQFDAFYEGFHSICNGQVIKLCRPEELEQLICGCSELDFNGLEKSTIYLHGFYPDHPLIIAFWEIVHNYSIERKKQLLAFVTGSDRVPIKGLGGMPFIIQRNGPDSDRLPTSFTCFSRLLLPEYSSKEKLAKYLTAAVENSRGFGLS
ncbi:HECT domain-containing protein [Balamuthia mandrillaris]